MFRTTAIAALFTVSLAHAASFPTGSTAHRPVDDSAFDEKLDEAASALAKRGAFFRPEELERADKKHTVAFAPEKPSVVKLPSGELYRRASRATVMLVAATQKDLEAEGMAPGVPATEAKLASRNGPGRKTRPGKIRRTSVGGATAFIVNSAGGVVVTCRHALEFDEPFVLAAVTAEGRVIGVKEILLSDKDNDLAFVKLDTADLPALPVAADIEAGEPIRVMSHPSGYYFHMTDGIIARHSRTDPDEKDDKTPRPPVLDITADIAEGSSGGAVIDERGNVVGVAQAYALAENDEQQTAFKHRCAIPSAVILKHMRPAE